MEHLRQEATRAKKLGLSKKEFFIALIIEFLMIAITTSFYMWFIWDVLEKIIK